ncbi:MAG TPA: TonB-dependent receptor [Sphingomonadaceae bacterium]|nr:TonB-dependent receptor [Sphingomonadaceae bacterium]
MIARCNPIISSRYVLALMLATAGGPALAQDGAPTSSDRSSQVEEIVVTAQFREQNLQSTPLAITAVSGAMMQARSQTNVAQIANEAPNVTLRPGNANFGPSLVASIRGIGQQDFNPALEPGVGMYVDDVYYPTLTGSIFDLLDLDRVEVLRGPQGTLSGRNSIGGAIKLYSKRPEGSNTGMLEATYGSRDRMSLRASVDFNIAQDLDARIAGVVKKQDGYVKDIDFGCANPPGSAVNPAVGGIPSFSSGGSCVRGHYGEIDYQAVRAQLRYHPSDAVDINIIGDYTGDDSSPPASVLTYANNPATGAIRGEYPTIPFDSRFLCGRYCNYANYIYPADPANGFPSSTTRRPSNSFNGWGISGQADIALTDTLKLTSITAYRKYKALFQNDDDLTPLPLSSSRSRLLFHFFSQELRLTGNIADAIDYTVGGYYSSQKSLYRTVQDLRWAGFQFRGNDPVPAHSKALFAHVAWHATDKLTLIGGLRYTDEDKDYTYSRLTVDGSGPAALVGGLEGQSGSYAKKRVDYRANAQYQFTETVMAYAQFATGFKGGGINPRPYFPSQVQSFGPETVNAYEVGLKTELFDRRARVNISAFFNDYKDIQLGLLSCPQYNPTPPGPGVPGLPCALPANAGDAHVKGFEVETSLRPTDGLLIDGSLSYLDFEYQRIDPAASGPGGVQLDYVTPYSAKWKWSAGIQYVIDLGGSGSLTPRFDAAYTSSVYTNAANAESNRVPAYTLANARLTWQNAGKDLAIAAEVTNLFDKYYYLNNFDLAASAGYVTSQPGRPREWALTVTKHF